ncbi:MAG: DUF2334 domain-containing protein [Ectobacillus sp.]
MKKLLLILLVFYLCVPASVAGAAAKSSSPKVLILYSAKDEDSITQVRILDMLVGHFTNDITIIRDVDFSASKKKYTHLFYMGEEKTDLSEQLRSYIDNFRGPLFFIGNNIEQLKERYSFLRVQERSEEDKLYAQEIHYPDANMATRIPDDEGDGKPVGIFLFDVIQEQGGKSLLYGKAGGEMKPLLIVKGNSYYFASNMLFDPYGRYMGEVLFTFFQKLPNEGKRPAYLRLEDVHPLSDPDKLMEVAQVLKERNIPYVVCVIPVYTNFKKNIEYHFSDSPKVVKALRYMQDNGGSIILHGYTHQYRDSETGEGYEFWDIENNSPVFQPKTAKKGREDFQTEEEFAAYVKKGKKYEEAYTRDKIVKGVQELVSHGLYPVAFEAPHYAMSQEGYKIASEYFSTYLGQLQISNKTADSTYAPPYETYPSFLHGMRLLPETVGFYDTSMRGKNPIAEIGKQAEEYARFSDGYIAGFYHPYLGAEHLSLLIKELEKIPGLQWIDLKKQHNTVKVPKVTIETGPDGIQVKERLLATKYKLHYEAARVSRGIMKGIVIIAGAAVLLFALGIIYLSIKGKRRNEPKSGHFFLKH